MSSRETIVDDYFFNVLNGAFEPGSDPEGREHTLGRLLLATAVEANLRNPYHDRTLYFYEPSWAPVEAIARVVKEEIRSFTIATGSRRLEYLYSGREAGSELKVNDYSKSIMPIHILPLGPEFDLETQQQIVAETAEDFFDDLPKFRRVANF